MKTKRNTYKNCTKDTGTYTRAVRIVKEKARQLKAGLYELPTQSYIILNVCLPLVIVNLVIFIVEYVKACSVNAYGARLYYEEMIPEILFPSAVSICLAIALDMFRRRFTEDHD